MCRKEKSRKQQSEIQTHTNRILLLATVLASVVGANATLYTTNCTSGFVNGTTIPDNNYSGWTDSRTLDAAPGWHRDAGQCGRHPEPRQRVEFIYDPRLPRERSGQVCEAVTGNVDVAPTIFALSGVSAPAGMDGRNLLPLLANPKDRVREVLPLFNFWGTNSAQSMAVVTPEWKYIYWYYGGNGMQPTEELFHVAQDRAEMVNVATESKNAAVLATMREHYDTELAALKAGVVSGHGYEVYPICFDRNIPWSEKPLVSKARVNAGAGE